MIVVGLICSAAAALAVEARASRRQKSKASSESVGTMMAVQPSADRMTTDVLVQTLATLTGALNDLIELLKRNESEREKEEDLAELRELRRTVEDIRSRE